MNKSLHPIKTANTPACMIAYDDKVQSKAFMTAGGASADFVHSPFFISSNYPETQSSWTTEMSNDRNYQTYYTQHYQRYLHSSGCDGNGNNCDHGTKPWRGLRWPPGCERPMSQGFYGSNWICSGAAHGFTGTRPSQVTTWRYQ